MTVENRYFVDIYPNATVFQIDIGEPIREVLDDLQGLWVTDKLLGNIYQIISAWYVENPVRYNEQQVFSSYLYIELARILPSYYISQKLITKTIMDNLSDPKNFGIVTETATSTEPAEVSTPEWDDKAIAKQWNRSRDYQSTFNDILTKNINSNVKYIATELQSLFVQVFEGPCINGMWW